MKEIIMITGGSRSGKSQYALKLAQRKTRRAFIATAEPIDEEMKERIADHQQKRGDKFLTIEEPFDLGRALCSLPDNIEVAIIDCLTVWLGNLMHKYREHYFLVQEKLKSLLDILSDLPCDLIIVTNEVGMGIIPFDPFTRKFRDLAGRLNQEVAGQAHQVIFMVSGIPLTIKVNSVWKS
jgi:adenosylcobinamide kinase/adenosylcobinamide-phosphate guanylyltransferase